MSKQNSSGGYVAILVLFLSVTLIIFFVIRTDLFTGQKGDKNIIERNKEALDSAEAVKLQVEQKSIFTEEE
jgi:hypothetical protein